VIFYEHQSKRWATSVPIGPCVRKPQAIDERQVNPGTQHDPARGLLERTGGTPLNDAQELVLGNIFMIYFFKSHTYAGL